MQAIETPMGPLNNKVRLSHQLAAQERPRVEVHGWRSGWGSEEQARKTLAGISWRTPKPASVN